MTRVARFMMKFLATPHTGNDKFLSFKAADGGMQAVVP